MEVEPQYLALMDALVELVVGDVLRLREMEKNAIGGADQANRRGVKDEHGNHTPDQ